MQYIDEGPGHSFSEPKWFEIPSNQSDFIYLKKIYEKGNNNYEEEYVDAKTILRWNISLSRGGWFLY